MKNKGEKYYQMRLDGLKNYEIAAKCNDLPYAVAARISEYRKKSGLPPPYSNKEKAERVKPHHARLNFDVPIKEDIEIRKSNHKKSERGEDGVLHCPVRYCEGYGFKPKNWI